MISELFFCGKLKNEKNMLIYEEEFVLFYLNILMLNTDTFSKEIVQLHLQNLYGKDNIKNNRIVKFCEKYFESKGKQYTLAISEEDKVLYQCVEKFQNNLTSILNIDKNNLYDILEKDLVDANIQFVEKLEKSIIYYCWNTSITVVGKFELLYKYFNILKNYYKFYRIIDSKLENIPELFNSLEILELNISEQQLSLLIFNNIYTLKNLKYMSIDSLICIFCDDISGFISEISKYAISKNELVNKLYMEINNILKPEWLNILSERIDLQSNKKINLSEIAGKLDLSRERVRQIESKCIQVLIKNSKELEKLLNCFYKDIKKEEKDFITVEELLNYIQNEQLVKCLLILLNTQNLNIRYNEEYGIIYNNKEISFDEILNDCRTALKDVILISSIDEWDKVQKHILDTEYKVYQQKIFLKKGINIREIYANEIKENFLDGYNIGSRSDYDKLIAVLTEKYGKIEISSIHAIHAMILREDFVLVDRGTYRAREYTINLPEKIVEEIIDFILKNAPIIYYSSIFEKFSEQLEKIGVTNRFYLKGVLDEKLPEEFIPNRDFIKTDIRETTTLYDIMPAIFKEYENEFTLEDIKEKMPGLKDYSYDNYIRAEEKNGLIRIAPKTYIYMDKLNITNETKIQLKEYIDNLFIKIDSKILTAQKIYANLSIMNKELLRKLNIKSGYGDVGLFYIIKYLFKNEYYFSRPVISLEEDFTTSSYVLTKEYVSRLDKFDYNDIKNYIQKMNMGRIYSYLNFMEDLSDKYVQFKKDGMIKIEKLNISKEALEKIKVFIDLLLKDNEFRTDNFDGYFMLPRLNKPWNKYLLIGIIRTYFKEEYQIENTTNYYDTTDFIVRRIV